MGQWSYYQGIQVRCRRCCYCHYHHQQNNNACFLCNHQLVCQKAAAVCWLFFRNSYRWCIRLRHSNAFEYLEDWTLILGFLLLLMMAVPVGKQTAYVWLDLFANRTSHAGDSLNFNHIISHSDLRRTERRILVSQDRKDPRNWMSSKSLERVSSHSKLITLVKSKN